MSFIKVASVNEIPEGAGKTIQVNGRAIAILNNQGKLFAIDNTCAHRGGPLGEGMCQNNIVTCPWHGWEYDLETGICTFDDSIKLPTFEVKIQGNDILINSEPKNTGGK